MAEALFYLEPDSRLSLQDQIRQRLVESISGGAFPPGSRLPSTRKLAGQLGVARKTVVLAYEQLVEEGLLESRERSGVFVSEQVAHSRVALSTASADGQARNHRWRARLRLDLSPAHQFRIPAEWQRQPYPFIDGYFDSSLYPIAQWREASKLALGSRIIEYGAVAEGSADDPDLIEQIRTKMLPRRGITASPGEILITAGEQNALYLLTQLLCNAHTIAAMEEPGDPRLRQLLRQSGARILSQGLDEHGIVVNRVLHGANIVFVTPSHQLPTSVTMDNRRREDLLDMAQAQDQLVVENDFETEQNFLGRPHPALRGMDREQRVVYVSGLPKVLSPGLRIGFIVADKPLIRQLRKLRQMVVGRPSLLTQRTAALFLSLGHYDAAMVRLHELLGKRWDALRQALNHYQRSTAVNLPTQGGTALWVQAPDFIPVERLAARAAERGVLIEPDTHYYSSSGGSRNFYRLGVTGIPEQRIRDGIRQLDSLIKELSAGHLETLDAYADGLLNGDQLRHTLTGATLHCSTFYCVPCSIELGPGGRMTGTAGHHNEDRDHGRWWLEQDLYCRQWKNWSYAEPGRYRVTLHDRRIRWWDPDNGRLVDTAILEPAGP